jgi:hypothetical protein
MAKKVGQASSLSPKSVGRASRLSPKSKKARDRQDACPTRQQPPRHARRFEPDIVAGRSAFESVVVLSDYVDDLLEKRKKELPSVWELRSKVPNLFLQGEELPPTADID